MALSRRLSPAKQVAARLKAALARFKVLARTRSSRRLRPGVLARTVTVSPRGSLAVLTSFGRGCDDRS